MAQRLERFKTMRADLKSLKLLAVTDVEISAGRQSVGTQMQAGNGEKVTVTFLFDPQPPNKLVGIGIELGDPQGEPKIAATPMSEAEFKQKVAGYLEDASKRDEFSGVVMVARNGQPVFQQAYGYADRAQKVRNRVDTKFNLGSINKVFTKMAIEQLIAAGKLSLDDKLGKLLPEYPNQQAREQVTVQQLLEMTSGIGDFFGERYMQTPKEKLRTLADYLPLFADKPLLFAPGTQERYSNGGYVVLGLIVEKVSGESYYDYVKQHIFAPAEMSDTDWYFSEQQVPNRAEGYSKRNGTPDWANNADSRPARGSSAGGGYSTAPDLLKFTHAIADGKLQGRKDGMGVAGGAPGINAMLIWNPRLGYTIIVLSNFDPPTAERTAEQIRDWMQAVK
jgi:CubicO group peptidase (beta-lactamase class C family)